MMRTTVRHCHIHILITEKQELQIFMLLYIIRLLLCSISQAYKEKLAEEMKMQMSIQYYPFCTWFNI